MNIISIQFLRYKEKSIIDTMIELKTLIEKYISEGITINRIKKEFLSIVNDQIEKPKRKGKRKAKKEICRPVMFISDSSSDEEN